MLFYEGVESVNRKGSMGPRSLADLPTVCPYCEGRPARSVDLGGGRLGAALTLAPFGSYARLAEYLTMVLRGTDYDLMSWKRGLTAPKATARQDCR